MNERLPLRSRCVRLCGLGAGAFLRAARRDRRPVARRRVARARSCSAVSAACSLAYPRHHAAVQPARGQSSQRRYRAPWREPHAHIARKNGPITAGARADRDTTNAQLWTELHPRSRVPGRSPAASRRNVREHRAAPRRGRQRSTDHGNTRIVPLMRAHGSFVTDRRSATGALKTRVSAMRLPCIGSRGCASEGMPHIAPPMHRELERRASTSIRTAPG